MLKLNIRLAFIYNYIKKHKNHFAKRIVFYSEFIKKKLCRDFLCYIFIVYLFFSLFPFFYSNLKLVTEALSVTPLFIYDNIKDKKV
jgi:hypothetical protein